MKVWRRALVSQPCGSCGLRGEWIKAGAPLLEIEIGGSKRVRCAKCAQEIFHETPPAELPDDAKLTFPRQKPEGHGFVTIGEVASANDQAVDFRKRAAGDN